MKVPKKKVTPPAYAQGEYAQRTQAMLAEAEAVYGRKPTPEEVVAIKQAVHDGLEPELPAPIPSPEEVKAARVAALLEENTRRDLEKLGRDLGLKVTKALFPTPQSLAEAIADKEAEA